MEKNNLEIEGLEEPGIRIVENVVEDEISLEKNYSKQNNNKKKDE